MSYANVIGCTEFAAGYQIVHIELGLGGWRNSSYPPFLSLSLSEGF